MTGRPGRPQVEGRSTRFLGRDVDGTESSLWVHMLCEDVANRVQLLLRSDDVKISALAPSGARVDNAIADMLGDKSRGDLKRGYSLFARHTAFTIMGYGRAVYEVVTEASSEGASKGDHNGRISLEWVLPTSVSARRRHYVQRIPKHVQQELGNPAEVRIPKADIVVFDPPPPTSPGAIRRIIRVLRALRSTPIDVSEWQAVSFDFESYHRATDLALARATRTIGWNARGALSERILEPYWLLREVRFRRFVLTLECNIRATLSRLLQARECGPASSAQILVEGLPLLSLA